MTIAGVDYSTHFVDIVLLDETSDAATWHRFPLEGQDAFDRARSVALAVPSRAMSFWDDVTAVGIEEPRGPGNGALLRIQGAILACVPASRLVQPWVPSAWRKAVGLPGNASKDVIRQRVWWQWPRFTGLAIQDGPPQDACDAYCIALATRNRLQHSEAA